MSVQKAVFYFLAILKNLLHVRPMFSSYALFLHGLAALRSLYFFSETGTSDVGAEAQAVGELPVPGNLSGNVIE